MILSLYAPFKLSLLFFAVGYAPTTNAKPGATQPSLDQHVTHQRARSDRNSLPFLRETQLYSRSSRGHLRIINRQVDALGKDGDPYAKLILESDNFGRVKIKGAKTAYYLCIKKDGRLVGRKVANANKNKCVFYEEYAANSFTEFSSAFNSKWMITVSKKGHTRPGFKGRSGQKAVQFIERPSKIIIPLQKPFIDGLRQYILQLLRTYRAKYGRRQSAWISNQGGLYKSRKRGKRRKNKNAKKNPSNRKNRRKTRKKSKKRNRKEMARRKALKRKKKKNEKATSSPGLRRH